ncbi:MAG: tRNA lysidine(34) synthetase TilS [Thermodesulfovibrionales bacterium]|nr:tRNA lysidine(34) synthetase TilS [Thermodesulfovibrionales bacterium]
MELLKKVKETIKKHSMLSSKERVLTALSGGPDSVCLLYVLKNLKDEFKLDLHAIYIDHGLRPEETPKEIEFCKKLCEKLNLPFITKFIDVKSYAKEKGINRQAAARQLRYQVFEETAFEINAHKIALGHTADDQAETLLMHLFRGSGPTGLSGIPPVRGRFIRPLIEIERREIDRYLREEEIDFIVDSSNLRKDYLRNKIRLSLMPMIKEVNPNIIETLSRTAAILREEERYFGIIVTKTLMRLISRKSDSRIELFLAPLEAMEKVILRRTLRRAIDETRGLRGINFIHIEDIIELIKSGKTGDRLYLPDGIRAIKEYSTLILTSEPPVKLDTYILEVPGEITLKEAGLSIKASIIEPSEVSQTVEGLQRTLAFFDAEKLTFPLTVRSRKSGDFFYPLGFGKKKKLQDFFVDEKVPRDERDRIPLIVSGEDIIWVMGYRGDERFKVTDETKKVLRLEARKI